jgi:hypothetical protein
MSIYFCIIYIIYNLFIDALLLWVEWVSDCACSLTLNEWIFQLYYIIMARTSYIRRDDNDVRFLLDQHS